MRALFHVTMPTSPMALCDAVIQEIAVIRTLVPGDIIHLYPAKTPGTRLPRRLWGILLAPAMPLLERDIDLHHVFNPDPYAFELLRFMRKPIVYTVVAGVQKNHKAAVQSLAKRVRVLVVPSDADVDRLRLWGITNAYCVRAGIDTSHFHHQSPPVGTSSTLLMGSAPWSTAQFASKGVDVMLALVRERTDLHLIFLFRGVLEDEMRRRVAAAGLQDRVEVLTEQVDVNQVLERSHAAVVLAADESLIKAYPHSLLESLAAGKPVLVSRVVAMAIEVERDGSGVVVERVNVSDVRAAVERLFANYPRYQAAAARAGQTVPTGRAMAEQYAALYRRVSQ